MGRKRRIKAENKRRSVDFDTLITNLNEEDELQRLLEMDIPSTYKCRPDYDHVRPCGPVSDDVPYANEQCACGCRADDWWCIVVADEYYGKIKVGYSEHLKRDTIWTELEDV